MESQSHYLGHRNRLKDKLRNNSRFLCDYEILELLLGYALPRRDTKPLAKVLLHRFGSLKGVLTAKPHELLAVDGFGRGLETYWILLREFWARFSLSHMEERECCTTPEEVATMARARLGFSQTEEFWLVLVDNKNRMISFEPIASGTVDQTAVFPREVMTRALERKASGMILIHNHPGGDPQPSRNDLNLTRSLCRSAEDLGLRVLDHIIVAEEKHISFQAQGLMN